MKGTEKVSEMSIKKAKSKEIIENSQIFHVNLTK